MIVLLVAAALASAAPAPAAACPDVVTAEAFVCRALAEQNAGNPAAAAAAFEQAAQAWPEKEPATARMLAAAGNMWLAANQPGKAALALDRALALTGLRAEQRGEALLDRARVAAAKSPIAWLPVGRRMRDASRFRKPAMMDLTASGRWGSALRRTRISSPTVTAATLAESMASPRLPVRWANGISWLMRS